MTTDVHTYIMHTYIHCTRKIDPVSVMITGAKTVTLILVGIGQYYILQNFGTHQFPRLVYYVLFSYNSPILHLALLALAAVTSALAVVTSTNCGSLFRSHFFSDSQTPNYSFEKKT